MRVRRCLVIAFAGMLAAQATHATLYSDSVGDEAFSHPHLDIVSVEIMNNATDIMLKIDLTGDPIATDWGKYLVGIDSVPGGDGAGNGWGRPISMPSGMDHWIGSWVDWGDGAEVYSWDGAAWNLDRSSNNAPPDDMPLPTKTTNSVTLTTSLASLGLGVGDTFMFDVFTTGGGGGDTAIDALSDPNPTVADWAESYVSVSELSYTVIPEPATLSLVLLGIGAMVLRGLRRK
jgi:hypothetical protein